MDTRAAAAWVVAAVVGAAAAWGDRRPSNITGWCAGSAQSPSRPPLSRPFPSNLANAYVISVSGIPIVTGDRQRTEDSDSDNGAAKGPSQDVLDRIKNLTYLEPKGKSPAQPSTVQAGSVGFETNVLLFGFPHDVLQLTPEDKEVSFTTQLGRLEVKTKFNLKEMVYRKELAL